jgi:hypothetical protein
MTPFKQILRALALALIVGGTTASGAFAQGGLGTGSIFIFPGLNLACGGSLVNTIDVPGLGVFTTVTTGTPTFQTIANVFNPNGTLMIPGSFTGTGVNPVLGPVTWTYDLGRPATISSAIANQIGADFPATGDLYFYITGTLGAFPGQVFRSQQEIHIRQTFLTSFNPASAMTVSLVNGPIAFENVATPGIVAFNLVGLDVTLNGSGEGGPGGGEGGGGNQPLE